MVVKDGNSNERFTINSTNDLKVRTIGNPLIVRTRKDYHKIALINSSYTQSLQQEQFTSFTIINQVRNHKAVKTVSEKMA